MINEDLKSSPLPAPITILRDQTQLVLEICHFTQELNPLWQTRALMEHLQQISHAALLNAKEAPTQEKAFAYLIDFFFEELSFQIRTQNQTLQSCFLPQVLLSREGPASLAMLLFCSLAEEAGLRVQVSSCRLKFLLKIQLDGKSHIVDFQQKCRPLKPYEIVDLINRGFDFSNGCLTDDCLVVEYLNDLKELARKEDRSQIQALIHGYLMRYQPFNLKHLSERAVLAYETGDYLTAIEDIRSYFQYKQEERNNINLKRIYKMALKRIRQN